ncbi:MAG: CHASE2 domain-containing protein [Desulfuromonadales bacterium]|nr:CHASE2 domain-containing protein [Desulfuromonadales bacterium]
MGSGLLITCVILLFFIFPPILLQQADLRVYDVMLLGRIKPAQSNIPVLVGIDEESIKDFGQWPWPRYRLASLVEKLYSYGAKVVTFDFLMPEADHTSPGVISEERKHDENGDKNIPQKLAEFDDNSKKLAQAFKKGSTVLGYYFYFSDEGGALSDSEPILPQGMVVSKSGVSTALWPKPIGSMRSISVLAKGVSSEGFTNAVHDVDGALRRVPLLIEYNDTMYPSLALASLLLSSEDRKIQLIKSAFQTFLIWGNHRIPIDDAGNLLIDFRTDSEPFHYMSAKTILEDKLPADVLKGKIVLVGSWAKGLGDSHLLPSGKFLSGLKIHATVIDNILTDSFVYRPAWGRGIEFFAIILIGVISTLLLSRPGYLLSLFVVLFGAGGSFLGAKELLVHKGIYLSPLYPMLAPIAILTCLGVMKYVIEARKVKQRTGDLLEAQDTIIVSMSALAETRDKETGKHILRTQKYLEILARGLSILPQYSYLDEATISLLCKSAPLHDIGKVGIPDKILGKPGKLTEEEYEIMKKHTLIGAEALGRATKGTKHPEQLEFLKFAQEMIESHHEKWDGTGYPFGLKGQEIPLAGRLMAVADVYDALVSKRVYKQGLSHEEACEIIIEGSGTQFDPDIVNMFLKHNEEFRTIAKEFVDTEEDELFYDVT